MFLFDVWRSKKEKETGIKRTSLMFVGAREEFALLYVHRGARLSFGNPEQPRTFLGLPLLRPEFWSRVLARAPELHMR